LDEEGNPIEEGESDRVRSEEGRQSSGRGEDSGDEEDEEEEDDDEDESSEESEQAAGARS